MSTLAMPDTPTLPVLPLPWPHVLLPSEQAIMPIQRKVARTLIKLLEASPNDEVVVAAIPINPSSVKLDSRANDPEQTNLNHTAWNEFGCSAKVIRMVRPAGSLTNQAHVVTLQGVQRLRLTQPPSPSNTPPPLSSHSITYLSPFPHASPQTAAAFRSVSVKLLTRLGSEDQVLNMDKRKEVFAYLMVLSGAGKLSVYGRLAKLVNEASEQQLPAISDVILAMIGGEFPEMVEYLSFGAGEARVSKATHILTRRFALLEVSTSVTKSLEEDLSRQQKEFVLRQQQAAISRELAKLKGETQPTTTSIPTGDKDLDDMDAQGNEDAEMNDLKAKISALTKGSEERKAAVREFRRLKRIPQGSVETSVIRTYLDRLLALPWPTESSASEPPSVMDRSFLNQARATLDADHYGLEKVKKRLIEYLAVLRLKQIAAAKENEAESQAKNLLDGGHLDDEKESQKSETSKNPKVTNGSTKVRRVVTKGPILLLHGPPGVGKTSIAQSLARALNRPFQRISLGGVRDEAEIRGHRRTYVASNPGSIVQALTKAGRLDPVILLDEIDKVSHSNYQGDPAAALLEVLDPEQNWSFNDHYINVPLDLSQVLFIATANTLDTISAPLLDRCEILRLPGYTHVEKLRIAQTYLIPKQLKASGMDAERCQINEPIVQSVIRGWTREAGVRGLERMVGAVVRAKAVEWSENQDGVASAESTSYSPVVKAEDLEIILGPERYDNEEREHRPKQGVVYGLVVTGEGEGGILPVETATLPGTGQLKLSGSLGGVIKESAELALSWVKSHAYALGLSPIPATDPLKHPDALDVHLHLPAGAQKKDGPSAGIAMICAFVSLLSGLTVPSTTAMTGEITLRGAVTAVGGVKEKVLGAHRAGIRKVILPKRNRPDVFGVGNGEGAVAEDVRKEMEFVFVERVEEALAAAFIDGQGARRDLVHQWARDGAMHVESRL